MIHLPFDDAWPDITAAMNNHQNLVIVAEPGAGKTTRFPPGTLAKDLVQGKVLVLEPRRLAARAAASRVSEEYSWNLPNEVGYVVRFDNRARPDTKLTYLTEGLFLRRLTEDPALPGVGAVVLDEFHERSRYTDIAIAALKELQTLERPDLRIIVMSATLDANAVSQFLELDGRPAPVISVPGRTFPVSVHNTLQPLKLVTDRDWVESVRTDILAIASGSFRVGETTIPPRTDDILVFLPGTGEIRRLKEALEPQLKDFEVLELHGSLSLDEQSRVLKRSGDRRRLILATNIAETSLTLDGVGTVIDSGLERFQETDRLGFSSLVLGRITLASAKQRAGRAGRTAAGVAIRLWSKMDELSFRPFTEAEILNLDLTDTVLELCGLGVFDPQSFGWFEAPSKEKLSHAIRTLEDLAAIDQDRRLTAIGKRMLASGLPARAARLLVEGERLQKPQLAASLAAILTERDFLLDRETHAHAASECDLYIRYQLLDSANGARSSGRRIDNQARQTALRARDSHLRFLTAHRSANRSPIHTEGQEEMWDEDLVAQLLLAGFPDRVARRRRSRHPQARMVGGRGVELHPSSTLETSELFFALRGDAGLSRGSGDPFVTMASPISLETLKALRPHEIRTDSQTVFDDESLSVYGLRASFYRDLPLTEGSREGAKAETALNVLKDELVKRRERLEGLEPIRTFLNRLKFATEASNESSSHLEEAFQLAMEETLFGKKSIQETFSEEGSEKFAATWERSLATLDQALAGRLQRLAPSHFHAPTGNRFRIHYPSDQAPFVAVRLQELFGTKENPKIGSTNLTFHLLGPNYRPVQVTSDLPGFWKGSYFEVRKELRARYPKHAWPENPLEAPAVAKGRPQRN